MINGKKISKTHANLTFSFKDFARLLMSPCSLSAVVTLKWELDWLPNGFYPSRGAGELTAWRVGAQLPVFLCLEQDLPPLSLYIDGRLTNGTLVNTDPDCSHFPLLPPLSFFLTPLIRLKHPVFCKGNCLSASSREPKGGLPLFHRTPVSFVSLISNLWINLLFSFYIDTCHNFLLGC